MLSKEMNRLGLIWFLSGLWLGMNIFASLPGTVDASVRILILLVPLVLILFIASRPLD